MKKTFQQTVSELTELVEAINKHPKLDTVLATDEHGNKWLQTTNALNGHLENIEQSLLDLLRKLDAILNSEFIDERGQHSNAFFDIKKLGWYTRTGESDSFGPLSSVLTPPDRCWSVVYG